ncbi:MAG TPA: hypothetical protein VN285_11040 [Candidatus Deferrimicrobium sp.]|nr:hypothetical protein [Candidatus Deferrimicrobium sp.]
MPMLTCYPVCGGAEARWRCGYSLPHRMFGEFAACVVSVASPLLA